MVRERECGKGDMKEPIQIESWSLVEPSISMLDRNRRQA